MREIKFRGKDNDCWAYGYYVANTFTNPAKHYIYHSANQKFIREVEPDTVGQYTGLKDKNGREIYEGDIIEDILTAEKQVVEFHGNAFTLVGYKSRFFFTVFRSNEKQIIGNIYDNPELLEVNNE